MLNEPLNNILSKIVPRPNNKMKTYKVCTMAIDKITAFCSLDNDSTLRSCS